MSKLEIIRQREQVKKLIKLGKQSGSHRNHIRIGSEGAVHFIIKSLACYQMKKQKKEFFTEAEVTGGKVDILDLDNRIIEIPISETERSLKEKSEKYPEGPEKLILRVPEETIRLIKSLTLQFDYEKYLEVWR